MINESKLCELLNENVPESLTLDFKSEPPRLDNNYFKSLFIKDVLSMANTPREETSYIIIGVKSNPNGTKTLLGVPGDHPDDADLHKFLNLAKVDPKPEFSYQTIRLNGLSYGIIEFPLKKDGPYLPTIKFEVLDPFRLYFRRSSGNDEASSHEQKQIYHWFHSTVESTDTFPSANVKFPYWPEFALSCHYFDNNRLFLFILGPSNETPVHAWRFLARLPLSLVLDFDTETSSTGAYKHVEPELKNARRFPHLLTLKDEYNLIPEKACYWYGARGLTERKRSLIPLDADSKKDSGWRKWNRTYSSSLDKLVEDFARASRGLPLTVVCLWYAPEYVREVCAIIDRKFDDAVNYVFAVPEAERLENLSHQFSANLFSMSLENVLCGITQYIEPFANNASIEVGVPRLDNTLYFLPQSDLLWLSEDLDILHSAIEKEELDKNREIEGNFLKGWTISWKDLSNHSDADRDATSNILDQIKYDLKSRTSVRYSLHHWPGAGGTTVARRIAWDLHQQIPTVLLRHITPGETIGRFRKLFSETEQSIFAVVEGAEITPDHLEKLYTEIQAENIPVVFLIVSRRFEIPLSSIPKQGERTAFISQTLSRDESTRFAEVYKKAVPERAGMLEMLRSKNLRERTPFIFALTAFEENFVGVSAFVQSRLEVATETQRDILKFIALVYYFAHQPLNIDIFATRLNQLKSQLLRLERQLGEPQLELLVKEERQKWRPVHQLIAQEILVSTLAGEGDRRVWWAGLSDLAIEFIKLCQDGSSIYDDDLIETLRRIFIQRDEQELLSTEKLDAGSPKFARLIEEVRYQDGQQLIFEQLVASFPQEAHFWGHLGRFHSIQKKPERALEALNEALRLSPEDPLLHHMKGMSYCRMAFEKMSALWFKPQTEEEKNLIIDGERDIKNIIENAKEAFAASRLFEPTSEHAYISQIQLLLRALDFGYSTSAFQKRTDFLISKGSVWYRDQLDEATYLMDQLKMLREGDRPSQLIKQYQKELDAIDGDQSYALERWNDLLAQARIFAPPIRRQIVRAYLARRKHDWALLPPKEIERIVTLMEQNIKEEPRSDYNIRYWFRAIRYSINQNITVALDRVTNWKTIGDSLEATFYLYVLYVLQTLDGDTARLVKTEELINQSMEKSRNLGKRTRSFEWLGEGTSLRRLKHYSELGEWDEEKDFYSNTTGLARVEGVVTKYRGPGAGTIEIASCGLPVFFVPAKAGIERGKHANVRVRFYLGFSYSGLRAWSVEPIK